MTHNGDIQCDIPESRKADEYSSNFSDGVRTCFFKTLMGSGLL